MLAMAQASTAGNKKQLQNRKKSAIKAARVAKRRRVINLRRSRTMKAAIGEMRGTANAENLSSAYQAIDKAVKGGLIKKNTAARMKSGLAKRLAK